jgi:hypothetical protein
LRDFEVLDRAYPEIKMEFIQLRGVFGPELIQQLCAEWHIQQTLCLLARLVIDFLIAWQTREESGSLFSLIISGSVGIIIIQVIGL